MLRASAVLGILLIGLTYSPLTGEAAAPVGLEIPAEHQAAIDEALFIGKVLATQYELVRHAEAALGADGESLLGEDVLPVLVLRPDHALVRFTAERDGVPVSLVDVRKYRSEDIGPVQWNDPPEPLEGPDTLLYHALRAALGANPMSCEDRYRALATAIEDRTVTVYLLAEPEDEAAAALAGHARVEVTWTDTAVTFAQPLSRSCLTADPPPPGAEPQFLAVTHSLSPEPNAVHVFLSYRHGVPVMVATEVGAWGVFGPDIALLRLADRPPATPDPPDSPAQESPPSPSAAVAEAATPEAVPPWRQRLVWSGSALRPFPWREDLRLASQAPAGYPDDFPVAFVNHEGPSKSEIIWVRLLQFDEPSGQYLGVALNRPLHLRTLRQGDNVAARLATDVNRLIAVDQHGDYARPGRPNSSDEGAAAQLYEGLRWYRVGQLGRTPDAWQECISHLAGALEAGGDSMDRDLRFAAHLLLGSCLVANGAPRQALHDLRQAVSLRPEDINANMTLLSAYSALTYGEEADASWEPQLLEHLALVRSLFPEVPRVQTALFEAFGVAPPAGDAEQSSAPPARQPTPGPTVLHWSIF